MLLLAPCYEKVTESGIGSWCRQLGILKGMNYKVPMSVHGHKLVTVLIDLPGYKSTTNISGYRADGLVS